MVIVAGVRFRKASKVYDFSANGQDVKAGDTVIVEVDRGLGMATVAFDPAEKDESKLRHKLKRIIRKADAVDLERQVFNVEREKEALSICKRKIVEYKLPMKLIRVEYLFDSSKAIFYFASEGRVDFRELVKDLASHFHTRIEMRQVGVRDEAKVTGGLGPCGRELCCSSFLSDFAPVTVKMAKEQNLALNPSKISGICGRLMCCLSFEHNRYSSKGKGGEGVKKCGGASKGGGHKCGDGPRKEGGQKREDRPRREGGPKSGGGQRRDGRPRRDSGPRREGRPQREAGPASGEEVKAGEGAPATGGAKPGAEGRPGGEDRPPRRRSRGRRSRGRRHGKGKGGDRGPRNAKPGSEGGENKGTTGPAKAPGGDNNSGGEKK